ncbi:ROK family transcriptional regulator [Cryobacterium sp. SO2]|uniref:ROK family transcriptional regulator n=1 Tax=Cryobacterium sp. SO2 TaxID=1897060 RepID=UPI00223E3B13|nr:ROK family transcriptional regulator [Cryobacterium sp. SO2]WEO77261.1 ROK family transcriptional regulator [Cryobacterium sp. SO2]
MTNSVPVRLVSSDVREHNLGVVLTHLDQAGPAGRAEIAAGTGLVRGSVTTLVADLVELGLVRAVDTDATGEPALPEPTRIGRPRSRMEIAGTRQAVLGIQFAVDEVLVYAADLAGRVLARAEHHVRTPIGDPEALVDLLAGYVTDAVNQLEAAGVAVLALEVVLPGRISAGSSLVTSSIEFGWYGVDIGGLLSTRLAVLPLGISVSNDANMAAYAEFDSLLHDPAVGRVTDMIYVKSDTGIGGGAIVDGRILQGARGAAFEPGHMIVSPDGPRCECGKDGCLVVVAGPTAVLHAAGLDDFRLDRGLPEALDELVRRVAGGEPEATAALADAARWFRIALSNLIVTLEPQVMVLGGYLAAFTGQLTPRVASTLAILGTDSLDGAHAVRASVNGRLAAVETAVTRRRRAFLADPSSLRLVSGEG